MHRWLLLILVATTATAANFARPCNPFPLPHQNTIMQRVPFDGQCGPSGSSPKDSASGRQNRVKNELCVTGDPALVTMLTFVKLQEESGVIGSPPKSRSRFQDILVTSEG